MMNFFKGEYEHNLDAKNRLFIPAKFRDGLGETFVIWKWFFDPCLYALSEEAFLDISQSIESSLSFADEDAALLKRAMYAGASDVEVDKQGRILIPAGLKAYAQLDKEAIVIGAGNHVEIWSADNWANRQQTMDTESLRRAVRNLRDQGVRI